MANIQKFVDEINRYMAQRQQLDPNTVYARLAPQYPGAFSMAHGDAAHGEDFEILLGTSPAGKFELYDNGLDIVFAVERPDGSYTHWHPEDTEDAVNAIVEFMKDTV